MSHEHKAKKLKVTVSGFISLYLVIDDLISWPTTHYSRIFVVVGHDVILTYFI